VIEVKPSSTWGLFYKSCSPKDRPLKRRYTEHQTITYSVVRGRGSGMGWVVCRACATEPYMRAIRRAEAGR
jgi:hypothetical protein